MTSDHSARQALPIFIRYADLCAAGIISNWTTLRRLIDDEGFPSGVMIGPNTRAWRLDEVEAWLAGRPIARKPIAEATRKAVSDARRRRAAVSNGEVA
jgi:predicted DNA-binding transcriptional regulator AlpA